MNIKFCIHFSSPTSYITWPIAASQISSTYKLMFYLKHKSEQPENLVAKVVMMMKGFSNKIWFLTEARNFIVWFWDQPSFIYSECKEL